MVPGFSATVQFGSEGDYGITRKVKMAALEDITTELSKLTNDISSAELRHGEVDFYIYKLDLLWKSIFQLHYDSNVDSNSFNGTLILSSINEAILCLKECNRLLDSAYRCPVEHTENVGRPRLSVTIEQLEYFINYDFSATDIAHMLNISVRTIQRCLQDFDLSIRASYSPVNDSELDDVVTEIIKEFPNIGYRRMHGELGRRKIKVTQHRVRDAMHRVDPSGVAMRWMNSIPRRSYNVTEPLALWHIDGHHKLIR